MGLSGQCPLFEPPLTGGPAGSRNALGLSPGPLENLLAGHYFGPLLQTRLRQCYRTHGELVAVTDRLSRLFTGRLCD